MAIHIHAYISLSNSASEGTGAGVSETFVHEIESCVCGYVSGTWHGEGIVRNVKVIGYVPTSLGFKLATV